MYQKYAPLWEKEEMERSQRWNAFLSNFPIAYAQAKPERYANAPTLTVSWRCCPCCGVTLPAVLIRLCLCCDPPGCIVDFVPLSLLGASICFAQLSDVLACLAALGHPVWPGS